MRWLAAAALLHAAPAAADASDSLGLGPEDAALGLSMAARPGMHAAYANPAVAAAGVGPEGHALALALVYARPSLHAAYLDDGAPLPLGDQPADTAALSLGARVNLGALVPGLGLALSYYQPLAHLFRWTVHPDDAPQWLFHDRNQHIGVHAALGFRWRWFAAGVGVRVLFDAEAFTTARVSEVDKVVDEEGEPALQVRAQLGEDVTVYGRAAPVAGLWFEPLPELRLALVYRGELYAGDWGWTRIQGVPGAGDLGYVHSFAHYFHPHTGVVAVAARPHPGLWLSLDLTYGRWEDALTANAAALGPGRFGDTLSIAAAVSFEVLPGARLLAGYRYAPSPFDNLGGPTNLLDGDQHVASTGVALGLGAVERVRFELGWALRSAFLVAREERKDPRRFGDDAAFLRNPGLRGYRHGGAIPGTELALSARW